MAIAAKTVWERFKEIDLFFNKSHPVFQTMHRLGERLEALNIPYVIMGGMAVNLHGAERTTKDVDILLTRDGLEKFRQDLVGTYYDQVPKRSRRFVDKETGTLVEILVTGHYPGQGGPAPFAFPDPTSVAQDIDQVKVVNLPQLVQLKLAARRHYDYGDVVFLIRVHNLDESFRAQLHPAVHQDFLECLEEKRREDEYEAREE